MREGHGESLVHARNHSIALGVAARTVDGKGAGEAGGGQEEEGRKHAGERNSLTAVEAFVKQLEEDGKLGSPGPRRGGREEEEERATKIYGWRESNREARLPVYVWNEEMWGML
jgi:hypothetical protein